MQGPNYLMIRHVDLCVLDTQRDFCYNEHLARPSFGTTVLYRKPQTCNNAARQQCCLGHCLHWKLLCILPSRAPVSKEEWSEIRGISKAGSGISKAGSRRRRNGCAATTWTDCMLELLSSKRDLHCQRHWRRPRSRTQLLPLLSSRHSNPCSVAAGTSACCSPPGSVLGLLAAPTAPAADGLPLDGSGATPLWPALVLVLLQEGQASTSATCVCLHWLLPSVR